MTESLFLLLHPTFIDTNTPVCKLISSLVISGFALGARTFPSKACGFPHSWAQCASACSCCPQGQSLWPLAVRGKVLTAVSLRNHTGPHQAVAATQQLGHPQHKPDPGPCLGTKACSGREGIPGSISMGCLQKVLVDRDSVEREKNSRNSQTNTQEGAGRHRRQRAEPASG